jgi:uncharacterized membrane protein
VTLGSVPGTVLATVVVTDVVTATDINGKLTAQSAVEVESRLDLLRSVLVVLTVHASVTLTGENRSGVEEEVFHDCVTY